ncbi:putative E3 ubiquitin-protein ligase LIN-1 [Cynara cardunculus var. scolymus]|uniref:putative E3 ubiquitin-protein ligase LIN-1 n=1 Tax=Cynara cardunculus var. scolymus TaxID=59895 RepID=UPI000D625CBB|nr:putative E3 ubiquitin-protein ligase LIN-1 [Cynara cardunculus var. scolymus]
MEEIESQIGGGNHTPPKDFVCPITTLVFSDPVTLETGQTYERKAIQKWIERGNSTCPVTHQKLHSVQLPKTNYVLKRLISSWKELIRRNDGFTESQFRNPENKNENNIPQLISPKSVISRATIDGTINELRVVITDLCTSQVLEKAEMAVLRIERFWKEVNMEVEIYNMLSKPPVINGFVEILFNSVNTQVLVTTVFLLSELGSRDGSVISTLTRVYSDMECIVALFKKGLFEAVVLIYLLKPSISSFLQMDMANALLNAVQKKDNEFLTMCVKPKAASVLLLSQIIASEDDHGAVSEVIRTLISGKAIECIIRSLQSDWTDERIAAMRILLRCIQKDGKCRNMIADKAELAPVLETFLEANDGERFEIVQFLSELVKLNRRTFNDQVLHIIKDEGTFSTMHTLLIYLQTALTDQCPVVAGLLLQLDLLAEPRKMSIYREEAIDNLISCLKNSDTPRAQIAAAETLLALQGRFSYSGKPLVRKFLLKRVGLDKTDRSMRKEQLAGVSGDVQETMEEEKAAQVWEVKMAFVLVNHDVGLIFEALSEGLKSRYVEVCSACFVTATWLLHMLTLLPDTGVQGAARACLLKRFVSIFKSAKDTEDKALSMLALSSFIHDPDGLRDITIHMKDILKGLRKFKKSSTVAFEMLKVFSEGSESSVEWWNHTELVQEDCGINGAAISIVFCEDKIFSGHSDGMIKIWTLKGSILRLTHETREHTKAVTSLTVLPSGNTLYSGSHDKTIRAWSIDKDSINCEEVYDVKEHVNNLLVVNNISCFIPQGAGIKVNSWSGASKLLNPSKDVKCLALVNGRLYSGCMDNSIQEIDLATGTLTSIQNGTRKLLAKANRVNVLQVHDEMIYVASSSIEGTTFKIWSASSYGLVQSVSLTSEVRTMAISSEFIYFGCKMGIVEVWYRNKVARKETLQTGTNSKVVCMDLNSNEDVLVIGTSDGKIHVWGLN